MRFTALVLRNIGQPMLSVAFAPVADALLSGGVGLAETALIAYDDPAAVTAALARLSEGSDGVFVLCDEVLLPAAREAVETAAGVPLEGSVAKGGKCLYVLLPTGEEGVRRAKEEGIPAVDALRGKSYYSVVIRTVMAPPELIMQAVEEARELGVFVHTGEDSGVGRLEVVYTSDTPKVTVDEAVRIIASTLDAYVYALEDISVGERLFEALKLHRMHISTAESFTGGGVGEAIVRNPGASKVFYEGLNTYDEGSKKERLGVTDYTLKTKGAVSGDTAYEMAAGLLKEGHCDVAVATTGVAGPGPDSAGTPAGTCFIAVGTSERVRVFEFHLNGDRETVTRQAVNLALFLAYKEIN